MWLDTCKLVKNNETINDSGKLIKSSENMIEVFCEEKSIGMREFYSAQTSNLKPEVQITVKIFDYNKERYVVYNEEEFTVVRTFHPQNSDDVELYLARGIHDAST
ncbi:MAG: hypothetical protein PHC62_03885 [Candidatus Izemoplasmatales bacterium]|nr:hypothetical protein [Candidatus Izemoplasmatales bacterium]